MKSARQDAIKIEKVDNQSYIVFKRNDQIYEKLKKLEKKHVHKGAIYYNLQLIYLLIDVNDLALLNIHKAFVEDDMKHYGIENFPRTDSYKFIVLDETCSNSFVKHLKSFLMA